MADVAERLHSLSDNATCAMKSFGNPRVVARYGLRGQRVGEAQHPWPPRRSRSRSRSTSRRHVARRLEWDLTSLDSSDDEPLVRSTVADTVALTQWDAGAEFSLSMGSEFRSGTESTPQSRICVLPPSAGRELVEVHAMGRGSSDNEARRDDNAGSSGSDTESVACEHRIRRRRLSLIWNQHAVSMPTASSNREVRAIANFFQELKARIGSVPVGSPLPTAIRQQRWSPVNVPFMWAAASAEDSCSVVDWLACAAGDLGETVEFHEGHIEGPNAVRAAWVAMRAVLRQWGVVQGEDLTEWFHSQGFRRCAVRSHIPARA